MGFLLFYSHFIYRILYFCLPRSISSVMFEEGKYVNYLFNLPLWREVTLLLFTKTRSRHTDEIVVVHLWKVRFYSFLLKWKNSEDVGYGRHFWKGNDGTWKTTAPILCLQSGPYDWSWPIGWDRKWLVSSLGWGNLKPWWFIIFSTPVKGTGGGSMWGAEMHFWKRAAQSCSAL